MTEYTVELLERSVPNDEATSALGIAGDRNRRADLLREFAFQVRGVCIADGLGRAPGPLALLQAPHQRLGLANRKPPGDHVVGRALLNNAVQRQQGARMAHLDRSCHQQVPHRRPQIQQAQQVGHRNARLAYRIGDLLLGEAELVSQPLQGVGLFQRVEILALDVLDERHGRSLLIANITNQGRNGVQARKAGSTPPPLTGDELVSALGSSSDHNGLHHSLGSDGGDQLGKGFLVEIPAGLVAVRYHLVEPDFGDLNAFGDSRALLTRAQIGHNLARQQRVQTSAQSLLGHAQLLTGRRPLRACA